MPHLLVTGFGPFPTMPRNPSAALARAVAGAPRLRLLGIEGRCRILTTAYATLPGEFGDALAEGPSAVLMIGVAGRSEVIRVERRATSRRSRLFPDATGETAGSPSGTLRRERRTRVPTAGPLLILGRAGLASRLSHDAGRYLCNAAYFRGLAEPCPVLFIHIPKSRRHGRAAHHRCLAAALVEIAAALVRQARVAAHGPLG